MSRPMPVNTTSLKEENSDITDIPASSKMKIYFGHDSTSNRKIAKSLQEKGISLLRAAPSEIPLVGLYAYPQPGYGDYAMNLPAFIYATEKKTRTTLTGVGYPVPTPYVNMIPIDFPPVFGVLRANSDPADVFAGEKWSSYSDRGKNKSFLVNASRGLLRIANDNRILTDEFSPAFASRFADVGSMMKIQQIVSGFLRTHVFPAFVDSDHLLAMKELWETEDMASDNNYQEQAKKRQMVKFETDDFTEVYGIPVEDILHKGKYEFKLHKAKPTTIPEKCWGSPNDIPKTYGIHFPFVLDLAKPDKETVPDVIDKLFLRCLGWDAQACINAHSKLAQSWKTSLCSTQWGHAMSHLFRVVDLAVRAQGRVFPIIERGVYLGSYLSGAGFSIGLKGTVVKPESYAANAAEIECYGGNDAIIRKLGDVMAGYTTEINMSEVSASISKGLRALDKYLRNCNLTEEAWESARRVCGEMRLVLPYKIANASNLKWALEQIESGQAPGDDEPMSADALGLNGLFESVLSVFGPLVPSPMLPDCPTINILEREPMKVHQVFGYRLTSLQQAVLDWKEMGSTGRFQNGPRDLKAPYEHGTISGQAARETVLSAMKRYAEWYMSAGGPGKGKEIVKSSVLGKRKGVGVEGAVFDFEDF